MNENLKTSLLEVLRYPRYLVRNELQLENCAHDGHFASHDSRCQECLDREDCRWLFEQDEEAAFSDRPLEQLVSALGYAIESVEGLIEAGKHDPLCHCETCLWRRQADTLYTQVRCHPELGPPPMPRSA